MTEDGRRIGAFDRPSWKDIEKYTRVLSKLINSSGFEPDFIIGISRGGLVPAALLTRLMPQTSFFSIEVVKEGNERRVSPSHHINWQAVDGRKVLLVEDMLETERSAAAVRSFLEQNGATVKLACYFTREASEIKPDFVIHEGVTAKIFFPWERLIKA